MTRDEAHTILNRLLDETVESSIEQRERHLTEYNPQLGQLFNEFLGTSLTPEEFIRKAKDCIVMSETKLGKALR